MPTEANVPIIATTTKSSIKVKPLNFLFNLDNSYSTTNLFVFC